MLTHLVFRLLHQYGLPFIFLLLGLENLGIPLPTEAAYIVAQTLITTGHYSYIEVLAVLQTSHCLGACISYAIARRFRKTPLGHEEALENSRSTFHKWAQKYGLLSVFFSRLVGYIRPWSSYAAGIADIPFWPFLLLTFLGTLLFNVVSLSFTGILVHLWHQYPSLRIILISISIIAVGIVLFLTKKKPASAPHTT